MSNIIEIPRYQCHKQVRALKIKLAIMNPRGVELHFDDERYCPIEMPIEYARKHTNAQGVQALAGGYVVWYEDGYTSWSPAEPFENGYVRIGDTPVAVTCNGAAYSYPEVAYAAAEEAEALSMVLNEAGIPRADENGVTYSLWGRVLRFAELSAGLTARIREELNDLIIGQPFNDDTCKEIARRIKRLPDLFNTDHLTDSQLADLKDRLKASKDCGHVMPMSRSGAIKVSMDLGNDPRQDGEQVED